VLLRDKHDSTVRYRLLDTIRDYGLEKATEHGEESTIRRRHRDRFLALVEQVCEGWLSPQGQSWIERLRVEHHNLRAALDFCVSEPDEAKAGLRLAAANWLGWRAMGSVSEGRRWLDRLLAVDTRPTADRARALWANSWLAIIQDDMQAADAMLKESRMLGRKLGDESVQAYVAMLSGQIAMARGDMTGASRLLETALAGHRNAADEVGLALTLLRLTFAVSALGDAERAAELAGEYLNLCATRGAQWLAQLGHWALGVEYWRRGDHARATAEAREIIAVNWSHGDQPGVAMGVELLAWAAAAEGRAERAARLLGVVDRIWRTVGAPLFGYRHLLPYHDECATKSSPSWGKSVSRPRSRTAPTSPSTTRSVTRWSSQPNQRCPRADG